MGGRKHQDNRVPGSVTGNENEKDKDAVCSLLPLSDMFLSLETLSVMGHSPHTLKFPSMGVERNPCRDMDINISSFISEDRKKPWIENLDYNPE